MIQTYAYSYPLVGKYNSLGEPKATDLGCIRAVGLYKHIEGETTLKTIEYELSASTSLTSFIEWLKAGGSYEDIEAATLKYCEGLFEQNNHSLQLIPDALS